MEGPSTAVLSDLFQKRIDVLEKRLDRLKQLSAPSKAHPPPPSPPTGLLRLPFELRLQIYNYCIPRKYVIDVSMLRFHTGGPYDGADRILNFNDAPNFEDDSLDLEDTSDSDGDVRYLEGDEVDLEDDNPDLKVDCWNREKNNSIFLLSKQISQEALDVLYGDNIFKLQLHGEGELCLKKVFAEGNWQRIRYLLLIAEPMGVSYEPGRMPDVSLWSSILPTLKGLRIVAEQPAEASSCHDSVTMIDMHYWVEWFKPFLQCFGQYLTSETIVQIDVDGRAETRELVKECLPHGYREIRCRHVGDLVFERGRFSRESGYWDDDDYYPMSSRDADGDYWDSD